MDELTPLQQQTLKLFAGSPIQSQFYWTGGTALAAVYLHHRKSQDLDFFSDEKFSIEAITSFIGEVKERTDLEFVEGHKIFDRREFFLHNGGELRLEFVHYDHSSLSERKIWNGVTVDSLDDMATNKLMALFDRNEPKDLVDTYFLLTKGGYSTKTLLNFVEKKFGVRFEESLIWSEALQGTQNLPQLQPLLFGTDLEQKQLLYEITSYFEIQSQQFLKRHLD